MTTEMPNFSFLQASSVVAVLLLTQLHFQTAMLGFSSAACAVCDVTWFWLLATILYYNTEQLLLEQPTLPSNAREGSVHHDGESSVQNVRTSFRESGLLYWADTPCLLRCLRRCLAVIGCSTASQKNRRTPFMFFRGAFFCCSLRALIEARKKPCVLPAVRVRQQMWLALQDCLTGTTMHRRRGLRRCFEAPPSRIGMRMEYRSRNKHFGCLQWHMRRCQA